MFDLGLLANPSANAQRDAVGLVVQQRIDDGTFNYTELLCAQEPMRTFALEYLDAVKVQGTVAQYMQGAHQDWNGQRVRLVCVNEHLLDARNGAPVLDASGNPVSDQIRYPVQKRFRVPGTSQVKTEKIMENFGSIADVLDSPGERLARMILVQHGWPIRQHVTKGGQEGRIVEWRWLEREARLGENAAMGVVELYQRLKPRVDAYDEARSKPAARTEDLPTKNKTATTEKARPGVSP